MNVACFDIGFVLHFLYLVIWCVHVGSFPWMLIPDLNIRGHGFRVVARDKIGFPDRSGSSMFGFPAPRWRVCASDGPAGLGLIGFVFHPCFCGQI